MADRDPYFMLTGTDASLPPSPAQIKASELIHRLRDARPRLRLVRGETDRIEVAPPNDGAACIKSAGGIKSAPTHPSRDVKARGIRSDSTHPAPPRQRAGLAPAARPAITSATDPRWVLAMRVAESLQGAILGPERRERLVRLGKLMGLTAFDANLVIAIVQDQARRGHAPDYCPTAGEAQLAMVPLPRTMDAKVDARTRRIGIITGVISVLVGIELVVLKWMFS